MNICLVECNRSELLNSLEAKLHEVQDIAINHRSIRTQKWLLDYAVQLRTEIALLTEIA